MSVLSHLVSARARQRHGVLSLHDLTELGVTAQQIRRSIDRGELERMHPGVFRVAGSPITYQQQVLVAVLAGGDGALASHRSAAVLWGLDGAVPGRAEIVTPRHLRSWAPHLGRIHESTDLHLADATERQAIPCTGVTRTLVDLGAVVPPGRLQQAIDDAIRRRLCTWDDLYHGLVRHSRRGRRGVGPLRAVLEECYGSQVPDSHFNRLVARLLIDAGLPAPALEHVVRTPDGQEVARLDLAYAPALLGIELDSRRYHMGAEAFEADRARQNRLELLGWLILRYTWRQYTQTPQRLITDVEAALRARGLL